MKKNLEHYLEVIERGIRNGKQYKSPYKTIVEMAKRDKKRKIDEAVGSNEATRCEDERLKLPDDELMPCEVAFKNALKRTYGEEYFA